MRFKKVLSSVFLFIAAITASQAQTMEVGVNVGAAGYMGDLNQTNPFDFSGIAFGDYNECQLPNTDPD